MPCFVAHPRRQVCGGPALSLLRHEELELLVCGLPHLDFGALEVRVDMCISEVCNSTRGRDQGQLELLVGVRPAAPGLRSPGGEAVGMCISGACLSTTGKWQGRWSCWRAAFRTCT